MPRETIPYSTMNLLMECFRNIARSSELSPSHISNVMMYTAALDQMEFILEGLNELFATLGDEGDVNKCKAFMIQGVKDMSEIRSKLFESYTILGSELYSEIPLIKDMMTMGKVEESVHLWALDIYMSADTFPESEECNTEYIDWDRMILPDRVDEGLKRSAFNYVYLELVHDALTKKLMTMREITTPDVSPQVDRFMDRLAYYQGVLGWRVAILAPEMSQCGAWNEDVSYGGL